MTSASALKKRFLTVVVLDAILMVIAGGFAVAYFRMGLEWGLYGFVGFIAAAFAVQLWFIAGLRGPKGGA